MTPAQSRAFSTVVRLGSVKRAALELDLTEAAVSLHIGKLRKLFDDRLSPVPPRAWPSPREACAWRAVPPTSTSN